ncbi:MAG: lytic murein transglycosylase [bacterium]|nr:lytic murein transglycosylase [bacterium]
MRTLLMGALAMLGFASARSGGPDTAFVVSPAFTVVYVVNRAADHERLVAALADSLDDFGFVASVLDDPRCSIDSAVLRWEPQYQGYDELITDSSVVYGRWYLNAHRAFLDSLSVVNGIPPELYVSQYRFETNFGRYQGMFRVIPALYTWYAVAKVEQSKRRPLRSRSFWRRELAAALRLARNGIIDLFTTPSSRKGAFGLTQFMPSQYHLARDGDGDGVVNLFNEHDALVSAGNHLLANGWSTNRRSQFQALRRYNRGAYGRAVLRYAALIAKP